MASRAIAPTNPERLNGSLWRRRGGSAGRTGPGEFCISQTRHSYGPASRRAHLLGSGPGIITGWAAMFRVSQRGDSIDDADTIEGAREIVRGQPSGRYDVDEIRGEPFPSGHTSRSWGRVIRHPDGQVEDEPRPWDRADERSTPAVPLGEMGP